MHYAMHYVTHYLPGARDKLGALFRQLAAVHDRENGNGRAVRHQVSIRLQPLSHTVPASVTYGYSLCHIRFQPLVHCEKGNRRAVRNVVLVT